MKTEPFGDVLKTSARKQLKANLDIADIKYAPTSQLSVR